MKDKNVASQSLLALGRIPTDTQEGRDDLQAAFNLWHEDHTRAQWPRALQSFENVSFLLGNHYARYLYDVSTGFGLSIAAATGTAPIPGVTTTSYDVIPKTVDNRLPRAVESLTGLLTEAQPAPRMEPNSDSPDDEDAAQLSEVVWNLISDRPLRLPKKLRRACVMASIFEYVCAETEFAETGEPIEVPKIAMEEAENPLTGEKELLPVEKGTEVTFREDEQVRLWSPLHVTPDPGATSEEDATWFARTTFEDVDWIRERYEQGDGRKMEDGFLLEKGDTIPIVAGSHHPLYWFTRIQDLLASPHDTYGAGLTASLMRSSGALPNQTTFTVVDHKPTPEFPRGRTLVWAGGKLIYAGDARAFHEKYPWRWHPYTFFRWFDIPGRFGGMAMLSELVPLQKRINAIDFLVQKNREYIAIGQWFIPKHAKVKLSYIGGIPGAQYEFNDVAGLSKPERVKNDPLPTALLEERDLLVRAIEYIASTGALEDQISKSAARAAAILDFLRNDKLRNKSPMIRNFEAFVEGIAQNALIDYQIHMTEDNPELTARVRMAAREYSDLSLQTFTGASLRDHHAIKIDIASEVRHSPEAREQRALEYAQYKGGQLAPEEDEAIKRAIGLDKYVKNEQDASVQRARRMVARIEDGMLEAYLPMPGIDDPVVMAPVFQRAILADRFLTHPQEVQQTLIAAFDEYRQAAEAKIMADMQQMLMASGQAEPGPLPPGAQAGPPTEPETEGE